MTRLATRGLPQRARQQGVAIVTALLLTTLAVTIVASLFWQLQVQVRSIENQRLHLQTRWILRGALDWARLILQQDGRDNDGVTTETAVWATALAETRLDDYVERERGDNEKYDATLLGRILDAQSRYNLGNLAKQRVVNVEQVKVFKKLLEGLQLNGNLAQAVAREVARGQPAADGEGAQGQQAAAAVAMADGVQPLAMTRVEDLLAVSGFTPQAIERLRELVIVLPDSAETEINVNMAAPELLAAMIDNFSVSEAATLVQYRKRTPFGKKSEFDQYLSQSGRQPPKIAYGVTSSYFIVQSHVRLGRAALDADSLLYRTPNKWTVNVRWIREN